MATIDYDNWNSEEIEELDSDDLLEIVYDLLHERDALRANIADLKRRMGLPNAKD